jgi:hypothetical protein
MLKEGVEGRMEVGRKEECKKKGAEGRNWKEGRRKSKRGW